MLRSHIYQATLKLALAVCLRRPESAETWVSRCQKLQKGAQHEQCTIEQVLPEEKSEWEETISDQEQEDVEQEVTFSPP